MKRNLFRIISCLLIAALCLTACSNSGNNNKQNDAPDNGSEDHELQYKDTVVVGVDAEPLGLDNHTFSGNPDIYAFRMVYDRLVDIDPITYEVIPSLAESWDLSDPLNYKFTLRDDVCFTNGEKLTAEDVKWSFERQLEIGVSKSFISSVESIEVVDDQNLILHLKMADAALLSHLTSPCCSIQWHGSLDSGEWQLMGTGAYTVENWKSGDSITFLRNDNYWKRDVVTERVVFRIMPENSARLIAAEVGEIDLCLNVTANDVNKVVDNPDLTLLQVASSGVQYLCIYVADTTSPLSDVRVRHALSCAVNKDDIITAIEGGNATPIVSCLGQGSLYRFTDFDDTYSYDLDRAKSLLKDAGYADGFTFKFICKDSQQQLMAQILQDQFKKINVTVDIESMENSAYTEAYNSGKFGMFTGLKNSSTGDPTDVMKQMYGPNAGSPGNRAFYQSDRFDELYDLQMAEGDEAKREAYVIEMQQIIMEDMPWILLYSPILSAAAGNGVGGFSLNPASLHDMSGIYCEVA